MMKFIRDLVISTLIYTLVCVMLSALTGTKVGGIQIRHIDDGKNDLILRFKWME
jgi:hypothetical protein